MKKWSGADMRCDKCNQYLPDRCTCKGMSLEKQRQLQEQVNTALDNAVENGYSEMHSWSSTNIAMDLITFDADLEDQTIDALIPFIEIWQVNKMNHSECYAELQDKWISEEECNSVDFDAIYGRYSLEDIRKELIKHRNAS